MEIAKHFRGIKKQNFKTLKMNVGNVKKYDFFHGRRLTDKH